MIDLFAGCGAMSLGFQSDGLFRSVMAVEADRDSAATYRVNFGDHVVAEPIENVDSIPRADVIIGGPPCQGFSTLNRDGVGLERRALWREYLRFVEASKPQAFIMENVPRLLDSPEFGELVQTARELGYRVEGRILDAADFGTPQRRRRAIVLGVTEGLRLEWPTPSHQDPGACDHPEPGLPSWVTFRQAVEGLPLNPDGRAWHRARNPRPESVTRYQAVPRDGGNRFQMQENLDRAGKGDLVPRCWRNKPKGTTDVFGRLWWDRPAVTIRTEFFKPEKGRYLHPSADRAITVREAARLTGLPDNFVLPEDQSMTSIARQVGNAVPPPLARVIARCVANALAGEHCASRAA